MAMDHDIPWHIILLVIDSIKFIDGSPIKYHNTSSHENSHSPTVVPWFPPMNFPVSPRFFHEDDDWLVFWNMNCMFPFSWEWKIIPTDFHSQTIIFQRDRSTTNQMMLLMMMMMIPYEFPMFSMLQMVPMVPCFPIDAPGFRSPGLGNTRPAGCGSQGGLDRGGPWLEGQNPWILGIC